MVDRNLTLEEFWRLSKEERGTNYVKLSEHDKFRVRLSMDPGVQGVPCNSCKHNHGDRTCDAYPNGIKAEHIRALIQDITTPCANGIYYKTK